MKDLTKCCYELHPEDCDCQTFGGVNCKKYSDEQLFNNKKPIYNGEIKDHANPKNELPAQ